jgi:asparagine synthase (glutamine-hydrolysing)
MGPKMVEHIDGMFSFVLYDTKKDIYFAARDHVGITTLYQGWRTCDDTVWFASEMKSLNQDCDRIIAFPPGTYYVSDTKEFVEVCVIDVSTTSLRGTLTARTMFQAWTMS